MEIKYQLEPKDLEAMTMFAHRGTPAGWLFRLMPLLGVLVTAAVATRLFDPRNPLASVVPAFLFLAFLALSWKRRYTTLRRRGAATFVPSTLSISVDGVAARTEARSSTAAWSAIQGFGETAGHVFLMLDGVTGYVIPKRALSTNEVETLVRELEQHTKRLPARPPFDARSVLRIVFFALGVVVLVFLAWHFGQVQKARQEVPQREDPTDERR